MENQEKQKASEPHVQIFGEEVGSKKDHHKHCDHKHHGCHHGCCGHHSGGIIWGLGILFVGVLLLLNNAGIVQREIWNYILPFWPVLLILAGFRIILGHGWVSHFVVSLLTLATFCLIVLYGLISVNSPLLDYWQIPPEFVNFISQLK